MPTYRIIGISVNNRKVNSIKLQEILSKHGHIIRARLGLHETKQEEDFGLIILHIDGKGEESKSLLDEINSIDGLTAKEIVLEN